MIQADLLKLLRCPQTRQALSLAGPATLAAVNEKRQGETVRLEAALIREDQAVLYPVDDGIPLLLVENAILL